MLSRSALAALALSPAVLSPALAAQGPVLSVEGTSPDGRLGDAITPVGDLDGDGMAELAIGVPGIESSSTQSLGEVRLVSGADGATLGTAFGTLGGTRFGAALAATRDVSGDGAPDLFVGAPEADRVVALDGAALAAGSAVVLWSHDGELGGKLGTSLASVGDVDGDGARDLAVGAPFAGGSVPTFGPGRVLVLSGDDGAPLLTIAAATNDADSFGWSLAGVGDLDGDGLGELAVGAPTQTTGTTTAGAAHFVSLNDGSILASAFGTREGEEFGHALAAGPVRDGGPTVFVAAPAGLASPAIAGRVVWTGSDGTTLAELSAREPGGRFGWALASSGSSRLAIGEPDAGRTYVVDVRAGSLLQLEASDRADDFGSALAWTRGYGPAPALVVGSPGFDTTPGGDEGRVEVYAPRR